MSSHAKSREKSKSPSLTCDLENRVPQDIDLRSQLPVSLSAATGINPIVGGSSSVSDVMQEPLAPPPPTIKATAANNDVIQTNLSEQSKNCDLIKKLVFIVIANRVHHSFLWTARKIYFM